MGLYRFPEVPDVVRLWNNTCTYVCIYTYIYMCVCMYTHSVYIYIRVYTRICIYAYTYRHTYKCTHTHIYIYICIICIYMYTYVYICVYIYIYTYAQMVFDFSSSRLRVFVQSWRRHAESSGNSALSLAWCCLLLNPAPQHLNNCEHYGPIFLIQLYHLVPQSDLNMRLVVIQASILP